MAIEILFYDSPHVARAAAEKFLISEPILNNLVLTLLAARIANPQPGRYWIAREGEEVVGMALQSPPSYAVNLTAMGADVAGALADEIVAGDFDLPGVAGEARIAARFAGQWAERCKVPVYPTDGQRIYEARTILEGVPAPGVMRRAVDADRQFLCDWVGAFQAETSGTAGDVSGFVRQRVSAGEMWLWDDGGACCMTAATAPAEGTTRVQYVYTPLAKRRNGYAETLVRSLTRQILGMGLQPILFTDLSNPTSNAVYRRIGYQAVAETLRYRFDISQKDDL